jgi:DNA-binding NarL/FixJ family response regulator
MCLRAPFFGAYGREKLVQAKAELIIIHKTHPTKDEVGGSMVRILIADDHEMLRRGLIQTLERHPNWEICGEASNGREAVELAEKTLPNVALLDLSMPQMNGLEATRAIKKASSNTEIMILTVHETDSLIREVLEAGARGYLLKTDPARQIVAAIEALAEHKPYFTWNVSKTMLDSYLARESGTDRSPVLSHLTSRERQVLQLLAEGRSNRAVSALLAISVKTVETHRAAIMKKLGIGSIAELVRYAVRNSVIQA